MAIFRSGRFWFGIGVSALCLWLAVRHLPWTELRDAMRHAHYTWLVPAALFQIWAVIARAQRWVVLLGPDARLLDAFWAQGVGYLFTNVLPLRMGEPARVLVMAQRCRLPVMQVATTAVVERLLDTATIVLALIVVLPWMQVPALVMRVGLACGVALLLAFGLLLCVVRFPHTGERLWRALGSWLPRLPVEAMVARWHEIVSGLLPLTHWQKALPACGWSLACWGLSIAMFWCVIRSLQADGAFLEATFMLVALAFAVAVPSSPGFIGIFQLVGQQALVLPFGAKYDASTALAITITAHLTYYLLTTALGMIGLWQLGESFGHLGRTLTRWSAGAMASRQKT
ncbi:MAG TPA: lysylphosphatidylglycerol synthase transmembrane domain-containing protein [Candidatus Tectomicrobia bacterium]